MRMSANTVRDINSRLCFASAGAEDTYMIRPWQYVLMEYDRMGLTPPAVIPPLESMEDAEIWMCLDARVNRAMRMRESALAG